jgi:hypothetical protein
MALLRFVPLFVAVAMLAAGCGESTVASVPELEQAIVLARDRSDFVLEAITRAQSKDEFLERMDDAADTIDDAAADLEAVRAPAKYESDVDRLVESLHQLAFDVQATADQVREPGFDDLLTGTRGLSFESWVDVNRALSALSREGIEVAPLERH